MDANTLTGNNTPLTDEQWAGLARMGDLGNRLDTLLHGPIAEPLTTFLDRAVAMDGRYGLTALAEKLLDTLSALERAGLLDLLRDNAQFFADSLDVLTPMLDQWLERIAELPADELKADAEFALTMLRKMRLITGFVEDKLARELTGKTVDLVEFMQRNDTDKSIAEALVQLGRIYRSGLLTRIGDLADYAASLEEGGDFELQFGSLTQALPKDAIGRSLHLLRSAEDAIVATRKDEEHLGGYAGMFHLLRDKEVQKGLRMLSVLPIYLEKRLENDAS